MPKQKDRIRIEVADDHPVVREGLAAIINQSPDMEVVAEVGNGREAVKQFNLRRPDVVLMDLRMPDVDGITAIQEILRTSPNARIMVLTTYNADYDIRRALEAGAKAYLLKGSPRSVLLDAIRAIYRGESLLPPEVSSILANGKQMPRFSEREMVVLRSIVTGASNRQIARELAITEGTVKVHVHRILQKLGAKGRAEAMATSLQQGIVQLPGADSKPAK